MFKLADQRALAVERAALLQITVIHALPGGTPLRFGVGLRF